MGVIVEFAPDPDGVEQITRTLSNLSNVDAVHVLSHGDGSGIQPGNSYLDADATLGYAGDLAGDLASWADAFKREADLLIYGCELGSTTDGRSLVDVLSEWHAPAESARPRQQWAPSTVGPVNSGRP
ncbi:MAG: DUF4347 domain-containing protein [Rubripirellula sp.]|nr:DUF4347 domain-containing protein [Rubripirellula sp.]